MSYKKEEFNNGVDWEKEEEKRTQNRYFEDEYEEIHVRTERIDHAPPDGQILTEGGQQARISSDGDRGRLITRSHKEYIRCDCGCVVDSALKTRRDENGLILCDKHSNLFCRLCSKLIPPGYQVKINDSYYHRHHCAEKVVDYILVEAEKKPDTLQTNVVGELKAMKSNLRAERWAEDWGIFKREIKCLFRRKKTNALTKRC